MSRSGAARITARLVPSAWFIGTSTAVQRSARTVSWGSVMEILEGRSHREPRHGVAPRRRLEVPAARLRDDDRARVAPVAHVVHAQELRELPATAALPEARAQVRDRVGGRGIHVLLIHIDLRRRMDLAAGMEPARRVAPDHLAVEDAPGNARKLRPRGDDRGRRAAREGLREMRVEPRVREDVLETGEASLERGLEAIASC